MVFRTYVHHEWRSVSLTMVPAVHDNNERKKIQVYLLSDQIQR